MTETDRALNESVCFIKTKSAFSASSIILSTPFLDNVQKTLSIQSMARWETAGVRVVISTERSFRSTGPVCVTPRSREEAGIKKSSLELYGDFPRNSVDSYLNRFLKLFNKVSRFFYSTVFEKDLLLSLHCKRVPGSLPRLSSKPARHFSHSRKADPLNGIPAVGLHSSFAQITGRADSRASHSPRSGALMTAIRPRPLFKSALQIMQQHTDKMNSPRKFN
ncbi:hypothetical protein CDAR_576301 [Caerostris darwini]|uniref:Uncharacterized protein n=1 Tax=Caerostris darwini TaxID=1538125 RepID=A0AAV4QB72_9ARAC|nr:hypothetical protein CDAR_576301 [Caerostris darwini]